MTPEALIVHYADDLDAKLNMMVCAQGRHNRGPGHVQAQPTRPTDLPRRSVAGTLSCAVAFCRRSLPLVQQRHTDRACYIFACTTRWWPERSQIVVPSFEAFGK